MLFVLWLVRLMSLTLALPIIGTDAGVAAAPSLAERGAYENYIVIFQNAQDTPDSVYQEVLKHLKDLGAKVNYQYNTIIKGFSVSMDADLVEKLLGFNTKDYPFIVEADKGVHAQ